MERIQTDMKKVLILAYDFPPYVSVGGLRPGSWYKYLHESGVYPIVVTRQWGNKYGNGLDYIAPGESHQTITEKSPEGEIIRAPYHPNLSNRLLLKYGESRFRFLRKAVSAYYEFAQFLYKTGPKKELYRAARAYLEDHRVDVIIATADPYVLFTYADALSNEFNTPWIADYRDPWSQSKEFQRNFLLKRWNTYLEKKYVQSASEIITVSEFLNIQIGQLIRGKQFHVLLNGYDPDVIDPQVEQGSEYLQIAFAGVIYNWNPIRGFLEVFSEFIEKHPQAKVRLNFYGVNTAQEIKAMIGESFPNLEYHVEFFPKIPNHLFLHILAKNNVMLLFNYYSYMGTKIFDYLGIRRKIMLCFSNDPGALKLKEQFYNIEELEGVSTHLQEDLLLETNGGITVRDTVHLFQILEDLYNEFQQNGCIACNSHGVERYSRKLQAAKLAEIIKKLA